MKKLLHSLDYAARCHSTQRRKDAEATPYINHPIGVAHILSEHGVDDEDIFCAAVLHDVIEDTEGTFEEIQKFFGERVAGIVAEVTDDKSLPKVDRKRLQVENVSKKSREAQLVKLADKYYNCTDLLASRPIGWTEERRNDYFHWAQRVTVQITGINPSLEKAMEELLYYACTCCEH